jgi:hypothetical protein
MARNEGMECGANCIKRATIFDQAVEYLPEIAFSVTVLVLVCIRIVEAYGAFLHGPGRDWNASEWMIDYAAGFVRRGLGGEALTVLMRLTGLGFFPVWATATTAVYLGLCCYVLHGIFRLGGRAVWRFGLLFNPAMLLFSAESVPYGSFMRKDVLFVCATVLNVILAHYALRGETTSLGIRTRRTTLLLCIAGTLSLALALLHEGLFLFCWFPLNLLILGFTLSRLRFRGWFIALLLALSFAPSLAATAAAVRSHGDTRAAQAICLSWHEFSIPTVCKSGNDNFPAAVDALNWTVADTVSNSAYAGWRFLGFLAIFALAGAVEIMAIHALVKKASVGHLVALLVLPFAASLPIFLFGWDWGRYLFVVMLQTLVVMLSNPLRPAAYCALPAALRSSAISRLVPSLEKILTGFSRVVERSPRLFCITLAMLPMPAVPFASAMLHANPVVICGMFLRHFSEMLHP